jgi:hypothetical protein
VLAVDTSHEVACALLAFVFGIPIDDLETGVEI